jgi:hypothetical protein
MNGPQRLGKEIAKIEKGSQTFGTQKVFAALRRPASGGFDPEPDGPLDPGLSPAPIPDPAVAKLEKTRFKGETGSDRGTGGARPRTDLLPR